MNKKILSMVLLALGASMGTFYAQPKMSCNDEFNYSEENVSNFLAVPENKALYEEAISALKDAYENEPVSSCSKFDNGTFTKDFLSLHGQRLLELHRAAQKVMGWTGDENLTLEYFEAYKDNECAESLNAVLALYIKYNIWFKNNGRPGDCTVWVQTPHGHQLSYEMGQYKNSR